MRAHFDAKKLELNAKADQIKATWRGWSAAAHVHPNASTIYTVKFELGGTVTV